MPVLSDHDSEVAPDVVTTLFINYQWRRLISDALQSYADSIIRTLDDSAVDDFRNKFQALLDDLYTVDDMGGIELGMIIPFAGLLDQIPAKYLLCNGALRASSEYPELAAILPPELIEGSNFRVPSLSAKFIRGGSTDANIGLTGGEMSHTLTVAELPAHHHSVPAHSHTYASFNNAGAGGANVVASGSTGGASTKTSSTQAATDTSDTGSGDAIPTLPPYQYFYYIIRALP